MISLCFGQTVVCFFQHIFKSKLDFVWRILNLIMTAMLIAMTNLRLMPQMNMCNDHLMNIERKLKNDIPRWTSNNYTILDHLELLHRSPWYLITHSFLFLLFIHHSDIFRSDVRAHTRLMTNLTQIWTRGKKTMIILCQQKAHLLWYSFDFHTLILHCRYYVRKSTVSLGRSLQRMNIDACHKMPF